MPNRKDRRANPDEWHRIVSYFDPEEDRVVELGDGAASIHIRGRLDNVIVVQIPDMTPEKQVKMLKGVQAAMEGAGIDKPIVLLPHFVKLVKFRTLSAAEGKKVDDHAKKKKMAEAIENAHAKHTKH